MNFPPVEQVDSLWISPALYARIEKYIRSNELETSYFNHGKGTVRSYTTSFHLQYSRSEKNWYNPNHYLKRGGRGYSKMVSKRKSFEEVDLITPSFESMYRNIVRKYPNEVIKVNLIKGTN